VTRLRVAVVGQVDVEGVRVVKEAEVVRVAEAGETGEEAAEAEADLVLVAAAVQVFGVG
jgi:hypothetical protein